MTKTNPSKMFLYYGSLLLTTCSSLLLLSHLPTATCQTDEVAAPYEDYPSATHTDCTVDFCEVVLSPDLVKRYKIHIPDGWDDKAATNMEEYNACKECTITIEIAYNGFAWLGMGVSRNGQMIGSHVVIGQPEIESPKLYRLFGKDKSLIEPSTDKQPLIDATIDFIDGKTFMEFTTSFENFGVESPMETEPMGIDLTEETTFIWAHGDDGQNVLTYHGSNRHSYTRFNLASHPIGNDKDEVPWYSQGSSSSHEQHSSHNKSAWVAHGVIAFIAWGICAPFAIASAILRDIDGATAWKGLEMAFSKVLQLICRIKKDNDAVSSTTAEPGTARDFVEKSMGLFSYWWFYIHVGCNSLNYLFTLIVFIIAVSTTSKENKAGEGEHWEHKHSKMGLAMFLFITFQVMGGYFRPSKVYKSTNASENETNNENEEANNTTVAKSVFSPTMPNKQQLRSAWEIIHNLLGVTLFVCGLWQMNAGMHLYHERYSSHTHVISLLVTAFYVTWMGSWTVIIVGGSVFKWIYRGKFGKDRKGSQFDGNADEQGVKTVGQFEIGNADDYVENEGTTTTTTTTTAVPATTAPVTDEKEGRNDSEDEIKEVI